MPVTRPEGPTAATEGLLLFQVPPDGAPPSNAEVVMHKELVPVMETEDAFTDTFIVAKQPGPIV
jgi:hypothetical protein